MDTLKNRKSQVVRKKAQKEANEARWDGMGWEDAEEKRKTREIPPDRRQTKLSSVTGGVTGSTTMWLQSAFVLRDKQVDATQPCHVCVPPPPRHAGWIHHTTIANK
eukprot:TRINITY_DN14431_c0_g1_i1.p1 TRINITY_DN14431_c0_g1~~TRINITY_DN14431_c0_g1_i1.p1  ORF type:complete len:106 (-),score=2.99 TRINITY_DN14431_c0_g1_i1:87-404(-)